MQKQFFTAIVAAVMAFGAVSCQKDDENYAADNGGNSPSLEISDLKAGEVAFVVSGEGAKSLQKAHYKSDDDHTILWDGSEEFSVFPVGKTTNEKFATSSEYAGMESCVIKGTPAETSDAYFALYPYSASAKYADGEFVNVSMPSVQNVSAGQYDTKADILVGYSSSIDFKMTFRHVGAKLGIKVPADAGDVKSIKITCTEYIAGTVSVALASGASSEPVATVTGGSKTIVMRSESGFEAGETYYVCVLPTSKESTIKVTFFTDDAQTKGKYSSATVSAIARNTKIPAAPLAKHEIETVTVKLSELGQSTNFPSSATKIVFDYLDNVDVSAFGEPKNLINGNIKVYNNGTEYYILSDKEICMSDGLEYMFYNYKSLKELVFNNFNTVSVTDMFSMFYGCSSLTSLDVSKFNTENVTDMFSMFSGCSALTSLDVSKFNTGNLQYMNSMFSRCKALTSLDLSNFNTENVTEMQFIFNECSSLTSLDVSNFNTDNVTDMRNMFTLCSSLTSLDVSNFNTGKVKIMSSMFQDCSALTTVYANDNFNTSNVTSSMYMFIGSKKLKGGNETTYNSSYIDKTYARVDKPGKPGYFTYKAPSAK